MPLVHRAIRDTQNRGKPRKRAPARKTVEGLGPANGQTAPRNKARWHWRRAEESHPRRRWDFTNDNAFARSILAFASQNQSTNISECNEQDHEFAVNLLVRCIIDENLPFAICDRRAGGKPGLFQLLFKFLRPLGRPPCLTVLRT